MNVKAKLLAAVIIVLCSNGAAHSQELKGQSSGSGQPLFDPAIIRASVESQRLCKLGEVQLKQREWKKAENSFQQSLSVWEGNLDAWYGLICCYEAAGEGGKILDAYRTAVYARPRHDKQPLPSPFREGRVDKIMQFALMLDYAKQTDEAVFVYNYAVNRLNYRDGKPYLKALLPEFGLNPTQKIYRPTLFQAMAHLAIGLTVGEDGLKAEHLNEALRLAPNSGVAHFHRGEMLRRSEDTEADAKAEYEKARALDPNGSGKAADVELNSFAMRGVRP